MRLAPQGRCDGKRPRGASTRLAYLKRNARAILSGLDHDFPAGFDAQHQAMGMPASGQGVNPQADNRYP